MVFALLCKYNAVISRVLVCLMRHLKHFYAKNDIKLSFGKVANCFMICREREGSTALYMTTAH
jgi:hypothetical protein